MLVKHKVHAWDKNETPKVRELDQVLVPEADHYRNEGTAHYAMMLAQANAEAFGRLAAKLVEKGVLTLDEAVECAGVNGAVTPAT